VLRGVSNIYIYTLYIYIYTYIYICKTVIEPGFGSFSGLQSSKAAAGRMKLSTPIIYHTLHTFHEKLLCLNGV